MEDLIKNLLLKPRWNLNDIKIYFQIKQTTASKIAQKAKKLHPRDAFGTPRRDDILEVMGVNLEKEMTIIKLIRVKELEERISKLEQKVNREAFIGDYK